MKSVRVHVLPLISKIKENREAHALIVREAQIGYRKAVIKQLDSLLAAAKEGKRIPHSLCFEMPVDHTKDYDLVLEMLGMEIEESVVIEAGDFARYVKDDWSWKHQFLETNSKYSAAAMACYDGGDLGSK